MFYLSLDQGGTSSRALVFDRLGQVVAEVKQSISTSRPCPHWVEHDPAELVLSLQEVARQAVAQLSDEQRQTLVSCGLVTQRSSIVCWDRQTGEVLSPVISWQDTRAVDALAIIKEHEQQIYQTTGLYPNAHFGASKIRWCLDNLPLVKQAKERNRLAIAPLASYLAYSLLEEHPYIVDPSNASRTLLMNLKTGDWDQELLNLWSIESDCLPAIVASNHHYGHMFIDGLNVPMHLLNGDQSAAAFAYGDPQHKSCYINMGTGVFIYRLSEQLTIKNKLLSSVIYWDEKPHYVREGTVNGSASALEWYAEKNNITSFAESLSNFFTSGVDQRAWPLFINGIGGLASPDWRAEFKSDFYQYNDRWQGVINIDDLTKEISVDVNHQSKITRLAAIAESIIFLIIRNFYLLNDNTCSEIRVSGGLSNSKKLCQWLADLSCLPVVITEQCEASARGAAYLLADKPKDWTVLATKHYSPQENKVLADRYQYWQELMAMALKD